ncbi:MAG: signal peptidase II [Stackebrandtia sp.]
MTSHDPTVVSSSEDSALPVRRPRLMLMFAAVAVASIMLDLLSKIVVVQTIDPDKPIRLLGGTVYLSLTRNSGAAFSFARDYTWALSCLAILVVAGIVFYAWKRLGSAGWAVALGLIAGGALGNLVDRMFRRPGFLHGHVVDFISLFDPAGGYFAIFNFADSSLVIGVCVVILLELRGRRIDGSAAVRPNRGGTGES